MTEKLYLLGHPIAHSKSPVMYNAVYERLGLPWHYEPADLATAEEARAFLAARDFLSVNITTPYKPEALRAATHRAASAKLAQGANLLVKHGDALIAYNTDGQGCVAFLERTGFSFDDASVVVCGTGPTSLAICHACAIAGAREVVLVGRDKERSRQVLETYVEAFDQLAHAAVDLPAAQEHHRSFRTAYDQTAFKFGSYATSTQAIGSADLVVNATTLGMKPDDPAPFEVGLLHEGQCVFDAVYGHGETALVVGARTAGCMVHDGAGMLVAQAVSSVQAVIDIAGADVDLEGIDLFSLMAEAAGFEVA
ncbi:shikimate dehydrogenase family protein [Gordonibacter sp.]|uniref:shikimate dehydrogenase family protein n=1 Tax=Gordonibacter sp. TaxID=1968902 RepID=UPI002FC99A6F